MCAWRKHKYSVYTVSMGFQSVDVCGHLLVPSSALLEKDLQDPKTVYHRNIPFHQMLRVSRLNFKDRIWLWIMTPWLFPTEHEPNTLPGRSTGH